MDTDMSDDQDQEPPPVCDVCHFLIRPGPCPGNFRSDYPQKETTA
jgi:hypothetical protein